MSRVSTTNVDYKISELDKSENKYHTGDFVLFVVRGIVTFNLECQKRLL